MVHLSCSVKSPEFEKEVLHILSLDARSSVLDLDNQALCFLIVVCPQLDSAQLGEFDCVADQIDQDLLQSARIANADWQRRRLALLSLLLDHVLIDLKERKTMIAYFELFID